MLSVFAVFALVNPSIQPSAYWKFAQLGSWQMEVPRLMPVEEHRLGFQGPETNRWQVKVHLISATPATRSERIRMVGVGMKALRQMARNSGLPDHIDFDSSHGGDRVRMQVFFKDSDGHRREFVYYLLFGRTVLEINVRGPANGKVGETFDWFYETIHEPKVKEDVARIIALFGGRIALPDVTVGDAMAERRSASSPLMAAA